MSRLAVHLRLIRVANAPTAAADVLAGCLFAGGGVGLIGPLLLLCTASVCFYSGGMVLNDVCDAQRDAQGRPDRPIPAGQISRRNAAIVAGLALAGGLALAVLAGPRPMRIALGLVAAIILYDVILKTTSLAPAVMGLCRALNLVLGVSLAGPLNQPMVIYAAVVYGLYVTAVTVFARREDQGGSGARLIGGGIGLVAAIVGLIGLLGVVDRPRSSCLLFAAATLVLITPSAWRAIGRRRPGDVQRAVGIMILSLILFNATLVCTTRGPAPAALVAALLIPAVAMRRWSRAS
ncbi:MAG: UbiA family prenyltransferase [Planctomycetes bacterium]|nr:UbiA family prenyltransferase [Planctomycetota bacterium]